MTLPTVPIRSGLMSSRRDRVQPLRPTKSCCVGTAEASPVVEREPGDLCVEPQLAEGNEVRIQTDLGDDEPAAGFQDPAQFEECSRRARNLSQYRAEVSSVEGRIRVRQSLSVSEPEHEIGRASLASPAPNDVQHFPLHVNDFERASWSDRLRDCHGLMTRTRTDLQNMFASLGIQ
jgi:hypothetical protein